MATARATPATVPDALLLVGFGAANRAVAAALLARGHRVVATDDAPHAATQGAAEALGLELVECPTPARLGELVAGVGGIVASPGLPDGHPVFAVAADTSTPVFTEFDLAAAWDHRPIAAITGTDGKTTVTTMVTAMLRAGGIPCTDAGNNDLPLVTAIDDPAPSWFVVEASSFRLGRSRRWAPRVGTWLNLAPDHLDVHATHADYEAAKARIWAEQGPDDIAIGNLDDDAVARRLADAPGVRISFSLTQQNADYRCAEGSLVGPSGPIVPIGELPRRLPHDLSNALAAAATAAAVGVDDDAIAETLRRFGPLPHRVSHVATIEGISYVDDSKATVPHATLAAVRGFESVVLIAGGRNKGLDLNELATGADHVRAVVAIGDAAAEVEAAFRGVRPVTRAESMSEAVRTATALAEPGDAVLLSPACASFDWYPNYAARGDDFTAAVTALREQP